MMFKKDIIAFSVMLLGVVLLSCELPNNTNPENNENGGYTIIFNANGGEGSISSIVFEPEENGRFLPVNNGEIYREGYRFISWNTVPDRVGGTEYMQGRYISAPVDNHVILYAQWYKEYSLRERGPGGGLIFYRRFDLEPVFEYPQWMYLEVSDTEVEKTWGGSSISSWLTKGSTSILTGVGLENTHLITAKFSGDYAAHYCQNFETVGVDEHSSNIVLHNDWYLPTRVELYYMNENLHKFNLGNFKNSTVDEENNIFDCFFYWTSCQYDLSDTTNRAYVMYFDSEHDTGSVSNSSYKDALNLVRPVRRF